MPSVLEASRVLLALAVSLCAAAPAAAQRVSGDLDVPYVPTNQPTVEAMLRIANVGPKDYVIDLGSGDGRILITAAKRYGARGFGVDIDPQRVKESIDNAKAAGVADRVQFVQRNLFDTKISEATVVTMYLLPRINLELRPRLLRELKPGTRVVSHDFDMGEWKADIRASVRGYGSEIHFWIVPARVGGRWQMQVAVPRGEQVFEIEFKQNYQEVEATGQRAGRPAWVREVRIEGDRIAFQVIDDADYHHRQQFEGRVSGNTMEGTVRGEGTAPRGQYKWRATRASP